MGICYIFGAGKGLPECFNRKNEDLVIAADGGIKGLERFGVKPDIAVGDFDSLGFVPDCDEIIKHPVMKNDTDMMLAVKTGFERGYTEFMLYGGAGGRPDHTFANIQTLLFADKKGATAILADENNFAFILRNDKAFIERNVNEKVSFFPLNGPAHGVSLEGFYYEVDNISLFPYDTLATSNFVIAPQGKATVKKGTLLVVISNEKQ